jgi:hypothetical protein
MSETDPLAAARDAAVAADTAKPVVAKQVGVTGGVKIARNPRTSARAPALRASGFLRLTGCTSVLAATLGVVIAPGLRGIAPDAVVEPVNRLAWTFAYFMCALVITAILLATFDLARASRIHVVSRVTAIGSAGGVVALSAPALVHSLPPSVSIALSISACVASLAAAWESARSRHTRAVAIILAAFAIAALGRVVSWEMARVAGEQSRQGLYALSRGVATGALLVEALGQMLAAAWIGTRSRFLGQSLASFAVAAAFLVTWNVARGASDLAAPWQSALHVALGGVPGLPAPFGMNALVVFLVVASMFLALVAAVQPREIAAVVVALALGLLGRGAFDVPLRALSATAGAVWLMVAVTDDRAMWRSLIDSRESG